MQRWRQFIFAAWSVEGRLKDLGIIIGAAGLASNLAALKALAGEGIQRGHMRLHRRKQQEAQREAKAQMGEPGI